MRNAPEYVEVGVNYSRVRYPHSELPPKSYIKVLYVRTYAPTGMENIDHIYVYSTSNAQRLIEFWNRTKEWEYRLYNR